VFVPSVVYYPRNGVNASIEILEGRAKGQPDEVVARRVEEIPAVRRIYIEEDAGDDNCLLLEKLFEERETVVDRVREILQVQPDVERRSWRYRDFELINGRQAFQYMITLRLEVLLEGNFLLVNVFWVQKWDSG